MSDDRFFTDSQAQRTDDPAVTADGRNVIDLAAQDPERPIQPHVTPFLATSAAPVYEADLTAAAVMNPLTPANPNHQNLLNPVQAAREDAIADVGEHDPAAHTDAPESVLAATSPFGTPNLSARADEAAAERAEDRAEVADAEPDAPDPAASVSPTDEVDPEPVR